MNDNEDLNDSAVLSAVCRSVSGVGLAGGTSIWRRYRSSPAPMAPRH